VLHHDGQIKYYDEKDDQKGTIVMEKTTRCIRTGKLSFEVQIDNRIYYLFGSSMQDVDSWLEEIQKVLALL
jgi:PH domain